MSKDWKDGYDEGFYRAEQEAGIRASQLEQEIEELEGHIEALSDALDNSNTAMNKLLSALNGRGANEF